MLIHLQSCGLGALCSCQETVNTSFRRNVVADKFVEWCWRPSYREYIVLSSWKDIVGGRAAMNTFKCRFLGIVMRALCLQHGASGRQRAGFYAQARWITCVNIFAHVQSELWPSIHHCLLLQKRKEYHNYSCINLSSNKLLYILSELSLLLLDC